MGKKTLVLGLSIDAVMSFGGSGFGGVWGFGLADCRVVAWFADVIRV